MSPTEPIQGPDFLFFEVLQDSRAKMQDSKGIFGVSGDLFHVGE